MLCKASVSPQNGIGFPLQTCRQDLLTSMGLTPAVEVHDKMVQKHNKSMTFTNEDGWSNILKWNIFQMYLCNMYFSNLGTFPMDLLFYFGNLYQLPPILCKMVVVSKWRLRLLNPVTTRINFILFNHLYLMLKCHSQRN